MAAETITPTCEVTGLPLTILPTEPRAIGVHFFGMRHEKHHLWHPKKDAFLYGSVAGLALRNSLIQTVHPALHSRYHNHYMGPELPKNIDDTFRLAVFGLAGVVSRSMIDVSDKVLVPTIRRNVDDARHELVSRQVGIDQKSQVATFIADYAKEQDIRRIVNDDLLIEEFLDRSTAKEDKLLIARLMLGEVLDSAIDELNLRYSHREFKAEGLIADEKPRTLFSVALKAVREQRAVALQHFVNESTQKLALQTGVTAV